MQATSLGDSKTRNILICIHERHISRLIETSLQRGGHWVRCVYDGHSATALLRQAESGREPVIFDWIIVDAGLALTGGYEVLEFARNSSFYKDVWVATMGTEEELDELRNKPIQPNEYIVKPSVRFGGLE